MERFFKGSLDGLLALSIAALIAVNAGLIPVDGNAETADAGFWPCYACAPGACPATIGWCLGTAGPIGSCAGWGLACWDGWPRCRGTWSPLVPPPAIPGAPCGGFTGC